MKFAAVLQDRVSSDDRQTNPLLLRVEVKAGHGAGKPISKTIIENSEVFVFMALTTGTTDRVFNNLNLK